MCSVREQRSLMSDDLFIYCTHFWLSWAEGCSQISTEAHFESKLRCKTKKTVRTQELSVSLGSEMKLLPELLNSVCTLHALLFQQQGWKIMLQVLNVWPRLICSDSSGKMWLQRLCRSTQLWLQNFQLIFLRLKIIWFKSSSGKWMKQNTCRIKLLLILEPGVLSLQMQLKFPALFSWLGRIISTAWNTENREVNRIIVGRS